jgi:hypothetical protein
MPTWEWTILIVSVIAGVVTGVILHAVSGVALKAISNLIARLTRTRAQTGAKSSDNQNEKLPRDYDDDLPRPYPDGFELATIIFTPHSFADLNHERDQSLHLYEEVLLGSAEVWKNSFGAMRFDNLFRIIEFLMREDNNSDLNSNSFIDRSRNYELMSKAGCGGSVSPIEATQVLAALSVSNKLELVSSTSTRGKRYLQVLRWFVGYSILRENVPRTFFLRVEPSPRRRQLHR